MIPILLLASIPSMLWSAEGSANNAAAGAPLAEMSYNPGGGLAPLAVANTSAGLFTNGPVGISVPLNLMAAINFAGAAGSDSATTADTLDYYDITDPAQAVLLSRQNLPGANSGHHKANGSAIGQVVFGADPVTARQSASLVRRALAAAHPNCEHRPF